MIGKRPHNIFLPSLQLGFVNLFFCFYPSFYSPPPPPQTLADGSVSKPGLSFNEFVAMVDKSEIREACSIGECSFFCSIIESFFCTTLSLVYFPNAQPRELILRVFFFFFVSKVFQIYSPLTRWSDGMRCYRNDWPRRCFVVFNPRVLLANELILVFSLFFFQKTNIFLIPLPTDPRLSRLLRLPLPPSAAEALCSMESARTWNTDQGGGGVHKNTTFITFYFKKTTDSVTPFLDEPYLCVLVYEIILGASLAFFPPSYNPITPPGPVVCLLSPSFPHAIAAVIHPPRVLAQQESPSMSKYDGWLFFWRCSHYWNLYHKDGVWNKDNKDGLSRK